VFLIFSLKYQSFLRRVVHQLFKSNLTFCVVCVFNLKYEKSVFLRRVVHSQSTLQRQLRYQILKNTLQSYQKLSILFCLLNNIRMIRIQLRIHMIIFNNPNLMIWEYQSITTYYYYTYIYYLFITISENR
jgi:hypothetical protein